MRDAFEALSGGVGRFVQSWLLPSLIAIGMGVLLLFPAVEDRGIFADAAELDRAAQGATIALLGLVLALVLSSVSTPLYRLLEGYQLPRRYAEPRRAKHQRRRRRLRNEIASRSDSPIARAVAREQLDRYPRASAYVMPTRLGNALKAGESYGRTQYGLDTVLLWNQLLAVAADDLKDGLTRTRTMMDFYVGVFWLSPVFAVASVGTAVYAKSEVRLLGVLALCACPMAYAAAVRAAALYASVLRALVDTSRGALAQRLLLKLPATMEEEIALWNAVSDLHAWGHNWTNAATWVATIDGARSANGDSS